MTAQTRRPLPWLVGSLLLSLTALGALAGCDDGGDNRPDSIQLDTSSEPDTSPIADVPEDYVPIEVMDDAFAVFHHVDFINANDPDITVTVLESGGHLPIIQGGQGINMVLVGFRSSAAFVEPLRIHLVLEVEGKLHSQTTWDFQSFHRDEGDGWRAMYNLFIGLDGCKTIREGTPGALVMTVTDAWGNTYQRRTEVSLGANDLCFG